MTIYELVIEKDHTYPYNEEMVLDMYVSMIDQNKSMDKRIDEIIGYLKALYVNLDAKTQKSLSKYSQIYTDFKRTVKYSPGINKSFEKTTFINYIIENTSYDAEIVFLAFDVIGKKYQNVFTQVWGQNLDKEVVVQTLNSKIRTDVVLAAAELRRVLKRIYQAHPYPGDIEGLTNAFYNRNNEKEKDVKKRIQKNNQPNDKELKKHSSKPIQQKEKFVTRNSHLSNKDRTTIESFFSSRQGQSLPHEVVLLLLSNTTSHIKDIFKEYLGDDYLENPKFINCTFKEAKPFYQAIKDVKKQLKPLLTTYNDSSNEKAKTIYDIPSETLTKLCKEKYDKSPKKVVNEKSKNNTNTNQKKKKAKDYKTIYDFYNGRSVNETLSEEIVNLLLENSAEFIRDIIKDTLGKDYKTNAVFTLPLNGKFKNAINISKKPLKPLINLYNQKYNQNICSYYEIPDNILVDLYKEYYGSMLIIDNKTTVYRYFRGKNNETLDNSIVDLLLENATDDQSQTLKEFLGKDYKNAANALEHKPKKFNIAIKNMKRKLIPLIDIYNEKYNQKVSTYYEIPTNILIELYNEYYKQKKELSDYFKGKKGEKLDEEIIILLIDNATEHQKDIIIKTLGNDYLNKIKPDTVMTSEFNIVKANIKFTLKPLVQVYNNTHEKQVQSYYEIPIEDLVKLYKEYYSDSKRFQKKSNEVKKVLEVVPVTTKSVNTYYTILDNDIRYKYLKRKTNEFTATITFLYFGFYLARPCSKQELCIIYNIENENIQEMIDIGQKILRDFCQIENKKENIKRILKK